MSLTVLITLTLAGADTGPFHLYSDADSYVTPFEYGVPKASLEAGYLSTLVPNTATIIRVKSISTLCTNYVDFPISGVVTTTTTSTTTTTTTSGTTTTTTTLSENNLEGQIVFNGTVSTINYTITFGSTPMALSALPSDGDFDSDTMTYGGSSVLVQVDKTSNGGYSEGDIDIRWFINGVEFGTPYTAITGTFINPQRTLTGVNVGDTLKVEIIEGE